MPVTTEPSARCSRVALLRTLISSSTAVLRETTTLPRRRLSLIILTGISCPTRESKLCTGRGSACDPGMKALDRKSTRLNSSHTVIYTLSLHDALPISTPVELDNLDWNILPHQGIQIVHRARVGLRSGHESLRSEEHTSELQSHRDLHSFPTRRSSDLDAG